MFKRSYLSFLILFIFLFLFVGNAYAFENNTDDFHIENKDYLEESTLELSNDDMVSKSHSLNGGSFSDIRDIISKASSGDTIKLSGKFSSDGKIINVNKKLKFTSDNGVTFDGKSKSGIFYLKNNAKGSSFYNFKFINGKRSVASAVFVNCKDVTFDNCKFEKNHGTDNGGGALATGWDKDIASGLTIKNCIFIANSAPASSGAVAAFSTNFKIINCIFENNYASNNVGRTAYEGALQAGMAGTQGIISGCIFKNNHVTSNKKDKPSYGGALGIRQGTTVENCYFEGNDADNGGAIYIFGEGIIKNCQFFNNKADFGGAIYSKGNNFNVYDSEFNNNAAEKGGSIYIENAKINMYDSNFQYDLSKKGASLYSTKSKINIYNSNFNNDDADEGGVLYTIDSQLIIKNSIFEGNNADIGGVISGNINLEIYNTNFTNNYAKIKGGVINSNKGTIKLFYSNFSDNYAEEKGGAVFINSGNLQIFNSSFEYNEANFGGSLYINKNSIITINNSDFNNNIALNGSAIYNQGLLEIHNSTFDKNQAKSYKIFSTSNSPIKKGNDIIIKVKLTVGDNILDAIYNNNGNVLIDNNKPRESCLAINQEIFLELNNETYSENTNEEGIACFVINSAEFKGGMYNYICYHPNSELYDFIEENDTLKIIEDVHKENVKKSKKLLKSNKKTKYSSKVISKKNKKIKTRKKSNKHNYHSRKYSKRISKNPVDIVKISKKGIKTFNKMIKYSKGNIWRFLDYPIIKINGYKKYSKKHPHRAELIDLLFGVDKNGKMSFIDLCLNLVSIIPGLGLSGRVLKSLGKSAKRIPKIKKFLKFSNKDKKYRFFIKKIRKGIKIVSTSLDLFQNSVGTVCTTFVGQSAKVFKNKNLRTIINSLRKNKPLGDKASNYMASAIEKFSKSKSYHVLKKSYKFFDNSIRTVTNVLSYPNYKEAYDKSKLAKGKNKYKKNNSLKTKYIKKLELKFNLFVKSKKNDVKKFLKRYKPQSNKKQIKIKTKDRLDYKFYKKSIKIQSITKSYYNQPINKRLSKINKHSKVTYKRYKSSKSAKTGYSTKKYHFSVSNTKSHNYKKYPFKKKFKLKRNAQTKVKLNFVSLIKSLVRW